MTTALITGVITLIGMIGSAIAWWIRRRDKAANPLPRHSAEVTLAREALGVVQASAQALEADVQRLRDDREADRRRIDMLEADVNHLRASWSAWYHDLRLRWNHHRAQDAPPRPPTNQED